MTTMGTVYNIDHVDKFPIDSPTRVYLVDGSKIGSLVYVGIRHEVLAPFSSSTGDVAESDSGSERGAIIEPSSRERLWEVLQPRRNNRRQPKKTPHYRQKNQRRSRKVLPPRRKRLLLPKPSEPLLPGLRFGSGPNNGQIHATLLRELQKVIQRATLLISQIMTNQG